MESANLDQKNPILLFDGVCNLCNSFVQFVIRHDAKAVFRFTPLQSEIGRRLMEKGHFPPEELSTVILVNKGKFYSHSDVPLQVVRNLPGAWPMLYTLRIIPKPIRDALYNWVAQNRYRWFGKRESCMLPTPELKQRFL